MRKEAATDLSQVAFDYFYWFSRFEFCLKENGYLKAEEAGAKAEPGWDKFVTRYAGRYVASHEARLLLGAPPEVQIVQANRVLDWRPIGLDDCNSELAKVARLVKAVRNNLFHGGKHGGASWDDPARTAFLLANGNAVLGQLAHLGEFEDDYRYRY